MHAAKPLACGVAVRGQARVRNGAAAVFVALSRCWVCVVRGLGSGRQGPHRRRCRGGEKRRR